MINQSTSTQIKITLPQELYFFLKGKANKLGLPVSTYVKNLAIHDVKDINFPTFPMSPETEKKGLEALAQYRAGKTKAVKDIGAFFDQI